MHTHFMSWQYSGLWGLLVLAADIWAILNVVQSGTTTGRKVIWILLILFLPVFGFVLWLLLGPRGR